MGDLDKRKTESGTLSSQLQCLQLENSELIKRKLEYSQKELNSVTLDPDFINTHGTRSFKNVLVYYTGLFYSWLYSLL